MREMDKAVQSLKNVKATMSPDNYSDSLYISKSTREYYEGKIIVLEGLDRTGKSTQLEVLKAEFEKAGAKVLAVHFPSGSRVGDTIYKELNEHRKEMTELEIWVNHLCAHFAITRERILPSLKDKYVVIADRWVTSAMVYNGITADSWNLADIVNLEAHATHHIHPEVFLYFRAYEDQLKGQFLFNAGYAYEDFFSDREIHPLQTNTTLRMNKVYYNSTVFKFEEWRDRGVETTSIDLFATLGKHAVDKTRGNQ